ncbi:MAG: PQQ-like beta-propeller repeat protein [Phycisphaerales bacterium]|nr:MAG: PQQ-like beta-propeller repeat protein [Phycisphaerales bacterium]
MRRKIVLVTVLAMAILTTYLACGGRQAQAQWPQWGGPNRDFTAQAAGLAESWPERGPKKLWKRRLGDGFSSIVVDDGLAYTMYRRGKRFEYTVALDARTGEKVWEYRSPSPVPEENEQFPGPHSTPIVSGDRLFSVGRGALLQCFDKKSGEVLWSHDLVAEFGCAISAWGYACSPIAYQNMVILPVGRRRPPFGQQSPHGQDQPEPAADDNAEGRTLIAFDQQDGSVVWKSQDFGFDHSSPVLIDFSGRQQLVMVTPEALFAVDPANGELLWQHVFENIEAYMVSPIWLDGNRLFCSTPRSGSRLFELADEDGHTVPQLRWESNSLRSAFLNPVRIDSLIVGSSGSSPAIMTCIDMETGERKWASREVSAATTVYADGKIIILTEDGELLLATVTPEALTVHCRHQITERESFSAPTLVGTTLYVRDRKYIMALDLG